MAKKTKKSKGRGSKPRGTVSSKQEPTPYNHAREALKVKMNEDSYLYILEIKIRAAIGRINERNHVIVHNLLVNNLPMETLQETFFFTHALETNITLQRQKLWHHSRRQRKSSYRQHAHVLMELQNYKKKKLIWNEESIEEMVRRMESELPTSEIGLYVEEAAQRSTAELHVARNVLADRKSENIS